MPPLTLQHTLQTILDNKWSTVKEIGELAGVAPSTVYRWVRGESEADFNAIRLLVRHLPNTQAIEAILHTLISGTTWHFYNTENRLDVNDDGVIDAQDALDSAINAVHTASRSLGEIRSGIGDQNHPDRDTYMTLIAILNDVIRHCTTSQQILAHLSDPQK